MESHSIKEALAKGMFAGERIERTALANILNVYPWFQMAQMLYAKELYLVNDPNDTKQLKFASLYAPDRKVLYKLIQTTRSYQNAKTSGAARIQPDLAVEKQKKPEEKPEITLTERHIVEEIEKSALSADITKQVGQRGKPSITPLPSPKIVGETSPKGREKSIRQGTPDLSHNHSFTEWFMVIRDEQIDEGLKKKQEMEMKLLESMTKLRPKKAFFSPSKAGQLSISDDFPVSETLAGILFSQGKYEKALAAYNSLIKLHPEKSSIFAARIKKMEGLIAEHKEKNK